MMEQLHQPHQPIQLAIEGGVAACYTNSEGTEFTGKTIPFSVGVTGLGDPQTRHLVLQAKELASGMVHYQVSSSSTTINSKCIFIYFFK